MFSSNCEVKTAFIMRMDYLKYTWYLDFYNSIL